MKHTHPALVLPLAAVFALAACSGSAPDSPQPSDTGTPAPVDMAAASGSPAPTANATYEEKSLDLPGRFRATGTEPFWGASVDGASLNYSTPEYPAGMAIPVKRKAAGGTVTYSGTIDGKPLELAISAGPCSDGMSDKIYTFNAVRSIGPDIERGCAEAN